MLGVTPKWALLGNERRKQGILPSMPVSKGRKKAKGPTPSRTPKKEVHPESPTWYVYTMFGLMGGGVVAVVSSYIYSLGNLWLLAGIVAIGAGFLMTTNYH